MAQYDVFLTYSDSRKDDILRIQKAFDESGVTYTDDTAMTNDGGVSELIGSCRSLVLVVGDDITGEDSRIVAQVEAAVKQGKVIITYADAADERSDSFDFLTGNSIAINAGDDAIERLVASVKSVEDKKNSKSRKKIIIPILIAVAVIIITGAALIATFLLNPKPTETGTDGELTWEYYEGSKTLKFLGTGKGAEFSVFGDENDVLPPWQDYADSIEKIVVKNGAAEFGMHTFVDLPNLKSVTLPDTLESLHPATFLNCEALTQLKLPDSITEISGSAIMNCGLTSLEIPAKTNIILSAPVAGCMDFTEYSVDPDNPYFCAVDGVLFDKDMTRLIQYPAKKAGAAYTVPATVRTLADSAFSFVTEAEQVILPEGLTEIPSFCFTGAMITRAEFPDTVTMIDEWAYSYCEKLSEVTLPEHLTLLGEFSLFQCPELKEIIIPDSVTEIGMLALSFGEKDGEYGKYRLAIKGSADSVAKAYTEQYSLEYEIIP